jgi:hypothetical protein
MKKNINSEVESFEDRAETVQVMSESVKKSVLPKKRLKFLIVLVLLALIGGGTYAYFKYHSKASIEKRAQVETVRLVKEVRKVMILPETDVPAVFDIQDPVLLTSQQAFFAGAEKGDKLLVYPQLGKAIIYSPSRHIIVNVGPVTFNDSVKSLEKNQ